MRRHPQQQRSRRLFFCSPSIFLLVTTTTTALLSLTGLSWAWTTTTTTISRHNSNNNSNNHNHKNFYPPNSFSNQKIIQRCPTTITSLFLSNDDEEDENSNNNNNSKNNSNDRLPEDNEKQEDRRRRMALVRSLQMSFYSSTSSRPQDVDTQDDDRNMDYHHQHQQHPHLDRETGKLLNLPLWRVQWWEVPGRSNVLNVNEPIYTNMFETILYGPKPWCFGHLYLKGGSRNLNSKQDKYQLETWESTTTPMTAMTSSGSTSTSSTTDDTNNNNKEEEQSSAVLGCLMNIVDYRRMADGRLLLLVHAMERFVVTDVIETLPYSIVNAQVLPDLEEMMMDPDLLGDIEAGGGGGNGNSMLLSEELLRYARAVAVQESIRFHDYEYDRNHELPVPSDTNELENDDIQQADIAKVLPFAPFSKTLQPPRESSLSRGLLAASTTTGSRASTTSTTTTSTDIDSASEQDDDDDEESCLEYRLLSEGVLQIPGFVDYPSEVTTSSQQQQQRGTYGLTTAELEYDLWLAINNFLIKTRTPVSPVLLGLLPPTTDDNDDDASSANAVGSSSSSSSWPKGFVLNRIVKELNDLDTDTVDHDFVLVPEDYPAYRRQRRLAYCAAHLLETINNNNDGKDTANEWRPRLLAAPSTQDRLRLVLEGFDHWQQEQWGAFE